MKPLMVLLNRGSGQLAGQRSVEGSLQQQRTALSAVARAAAGRRCRRAANARWHTSAFATRPQAAATTAASARGLHQLQHHAHASLQRQRIIPLDYMPRSTELRHSPLACPTSGCSYCCSCTMSRAARTEGRPHTHLRTTLLTSTSPSGGQLSRQRLAEAVVATIRVLHNTKHFTHTHTHRTYTLTPATQNTQVRLSTAHGGLKSRSSPRVSHAVQKAASGTNSVHARETLAHHDTRCLLTNTRQ